MKYGLMKMSMVDYPGQICATIFSPGCNFKCGYCHNAELVLGGDYESYSIQEIYDFLDTRKGLLDGVCITGGEATLNKNIEEICKTIKAKGFKIKIDTNGTNPDLLHYLMNHNLIDYVAMDIKGPLESYNKIADAQVDLEAVLESIVILKESNIDYEFRTTVNNKDFKESDFDKIGKLLKGAKVYVLQKFRNEKTLSPSYKDVKSFDDETFERIKNTMKTYVGNVFIR